MKIINSMYNLRSVWRMTSFVLVLCIVSTSFFGDSCATQAQQFYPSGRYGRRDSMPPLADVVGGREMTVAFFGDGSVRCVHTGYEDYYRCSRKTAENRGIPTPLDE